MPLGIPVLKDIGLNLDKHLLDVVPEDTSEHISNIRVVGFKQCKKVYKGLYNYTNGILKENYPPLLVGNVVSFFDS